METRVSMVNFNLLVFGLFGNSSSRFYLSVINITFSYVPLLLLVILSLSSNITEWRVYSEKLQSSFVIEACKCWVTVLVYILYLLGDGV